MSTTDLLIYGMCAGMILIGIMVIRFSRRDRGMGAIAIALGLIGLAAYLVAEEGTPPPPVTTPTVVEDSMPAEASPTLSTPEQ